MITLWFHRAVFSPIGAGIALLVDVFIEANRMRLLARRRHAALEE